MTETAYDVVVVGAGPAGLSAALTLGRGCRRVLLCDGERRRNAAAVAIHGFVTRDGTPPDEFRQLGRAQLVPYDVTVRDVSVMEVTGEVDHFSVALASGESATARRVLLTLGVVDHMLELPGFSRLWGRSIFACPYCHGWEVRQQPWGVLANSAAMLEFAPFLRNWAPAVTVFTDGTYPLPDEPAHRQDIHFETRVVRSLVGEDHLEAVELVDGTRLPLGVLFARPLQKQTPLVAGLHVDLDDMGYVRVNAMGETSRPGIHAAGDLTTMMQSVVVAASAGSVAAAAINHLLVLGAHAAWGPKR